MILKGKDRDHLRAHLAGAGLTKKETENVIAEAGKRIAVAAAYDKTEQVGVALTRLNEIFTLGVELADPKTALAAQKELNKLMDLYTVEASEGASDEAHTEAERENKAALAYLEPLTLADQGTPLSELCRIAAAKLLNAE